MLICYVNMCIYITLKVFSYSAMRTLRQMSCSSIYYHAPLESYQAFTADQNGDRNIGVWTVFQVLHRLCMFFYTGDYLEIIELVQILDSSGLLLVDYFARHMSALKWIKFMHIQIIIILELIKLE
jgi:hypothetical protein